MQLKHAQRTKVEKEPDLYPTKKDLKEGGQELYSATTYFEKLKPSGKILSQDDCSGKRSLAGLWLDPHPSIDGESE